MEALSSFLAGIQDFAAAAVAILGTLLLLFLAPGEALGWLKKLLILSVIVGLWIVFVEPERQSILIMAYYVLHFWFFPLMTEEALVFLVQCFLFLITFKLTVWFLSIDAPHHGPEHHSKFKSRKV